MARVKTPKRIFMILNVLLLVGLSGSTGYLFIRNRDLNSELKLTTDERNKRNNERLINEIKKVFELPDEEPQVIYVNDGTKAGEENPGISAVFNDLQTGDYILLYKKARIGVQYRPAQKKVVFSSKISVPISVELIGSAEAIADAEKKLADFGNQITLTKTIKDGITQSFVFDVDDDQKAEADSIAKQLGIEIGATLPSSITPIAQTEVVVVLSNDKTATPTSETATPQEP